jgi:hypothetical protein
LFANRYAQPQRHIGARLLDQAALVTWCSACAATHKMGRRRARDWSQAFTLWLPSKVAMLNIGPPRLRAEWLYRPFSNFLRRDGKRSESPIGILHRNRSQPLNCTLEACASSHTKARSRRLTSDWPPIRRACLNHCNAGCQAARHQRTDDRYLAEARDVKRLRQLEAENGRLKKLVAEGDLDGRVSEHTRFMLQSTIPTV